MPSRSSRLAAAPSKQHKVRTRHLILIGSCTEHLYEREPESKARLMRRPDKLVSKVVDRELFGLPLREWSGLPLSQAAARPSSESARRAPRSLAAGPRARRPQSARPIRAGKPIGARGPCPKLLCARH